MPTYEKGNVRIHFQEAGEGFPWKEPKERIPVAVRQVRSLLRAHAPVPA